MKQWKGLAMWASQPTVEGFYWYFDATELPDYRLQVVKYEKGPYGVLFPADECTRNVSDLPGKWYGPLEAPAMEDI